MPNSRSQKALAQQLHVGRQTAKIFAFPGRKGKPIARKKLVGPPTMTALVEDLLREYGSFTIWGIQRHFSKARNGGLTDVQIYNVVYHLWRCGAVSWSTVDTIRRTPKNDQRRYTFPTRSRNY